MWEKLGHIFVAQGQFPWMATHATTPFAQSLGDGRVRCYFSVRDAQNRSHIASADIDPRRPGELLSLSNEPLLSPGRTGTFDDSGVSMMQIVEHQGKRYLYYLGWNLGVTVLFRNSVGLAIADAGSDRFTKWTEAPVLDRHPFDPLTISSPWVLVENGQWKMWYGSHLSWEEDGLDMRYIIKYATSDDGIAWHRTNQTVLDVREGESAVVRPSILHEGGWYHMWYSRRIGRKETCRIGYAASRDGLRWERRDEEVNLTVSDKGWDSEMICYPCVFNHAGERFMLYNGNGFGRTGFGLARWRE